MKKQQQQFQKQVFESLKFSTHLPLLGHNACVRSLAKIDDKYFVSAGGDIKIWTTKGECIRTLEEEPNVVIVLSNGLIASGSEEGEIKLWKVDGSCVQTIKAGIDITSLLELADGRIACGDYEGAIQIFNKDGKVTAKFSGGSSQIKSLIQLNNASLVSASVDGIKFWDLKEGKCTNTISKYSERVSCSLKDGGFAASEDNKVKIYDAEGKCLKTLVGHASQITCLIELQNGCLASGSSDKTIKIWNREGKCLKTLQGHSKDVKSLLEFEDGILISGSYDKTINIWSH